MKKLLFLLLLVACSSTLIARNLSNGIYALDSNNHAVKLLQVNKDCVGVLVVTDVTTFVIDKLEDMNKLYVGTWMGWGNSGGFSFGGFGEESNLSDRTSFENAIADYDGFGNTSIILSEKQMNWNGQSDSRNVTMKRLLLQGKHSDSTFNWYIPSAGQMNIILQNTEEINAYLQAMGGCQLMTDCSYLTSTEKNTYICWIADFVNQKICNAPKDSRLRLRLVRAL